MVGAMKKDETKSAAGRIGGMVKTAKGFAVNAKARAKAIRASAATRKRKAKERRRLVELLVVGGSLVDSKKRQFSI